MAGTKPDERLRTPMHWDGSRFAGFTVGDSVWEPLQNADNVAVANVAGQTSDPDSLLSHYRNLIHLRNSNSALRRGGYTAVDSSAREIYAFLRHDAEQTLLVAINLSDERASDYTLALPESALEFGAPTLLYGAGELAQPEFNANGGFGAYKPLAEIDPQSLIVIQF